LFLLEFEQGLEMKIGSVGFTVFAKLRHIFIDKSMESLVFCPHTPETDIIIGEITNPVSHP